MKSFSIVFIFFSFILTAQNYTSDWYGINEGLPQNSIKDIIKDDYGFIWLSTDGGIVRYDGASFSTYNHLKISSYSFNNFIIAKNIGITCFNNNETDCVTLKDRAVKLINRAKVASTYSIHRNKQFKRFYKNTFTNKFFPDINFYYIEVESGKYFFDNNGIEYRSSSGIKKILCSRNFRHSQLQNVYEHNGTVYISDPERRQTLVLSDGKATFDKTPTLYNDPQSRIYWHQSTGQVFIINNGKIYNSTFRGEKPQLEFLLNYKDVEKKHLSSIFYDEREQKIYFGSIVKGLNIVSLSNFYVSTKNVAFSNEVCYEALKFSENSIITKEGIEYTHKGTRKIFDSDIRYDKRYILYDDSGNILYIDNKIYRRSRSFRFQQRDSLEFSGRKAVEGIFKVSGKYIVITSDYHFNNYLNVYADDQFKKLLRASKFKKNISSVIACNEDMLWVGCADGIYLFSVATGKAIRHLARNIPVKEIFRFSDGSFWFTTYDRGIYLLKNKSVMKMPYDRDGYISSAHHIIEDRLGFFWISSNNGLFKVSKKMLSDYADQTSDKVYYYRFTKNNGFLNNEFNGSSNPGGNILANGEFVFPSMEGFVFYKPEQIKSYYPRKEDLYIERASIDDKVKYFKDHLKLKSDFKDVDLFLDIPYYHDIRNIYLEIKLKGDRQSEWEMIGHDKKYTLPDLTPGNHILTVRYLLNDQGTFTYKNIHVDIEPYFYQTFCFKLLVILMAVSGVLVIIRLRTRVLHKSNEILRMNLDQSNSKLREASSNLETTQYLLKNESEYQQKVVESISHDIMTPVRFISQLSQKLSQSNDAELQKKYFDGIFKSSEQLYKFTLGLQQYTELYRENTVYSEQSYSPDEVIAEKVILFEEIALHKNSDIHHMKNPAVVIYENRNIISVILHNLIDNAVKYSAGGEIWIRTYTEHHQIVIEIKDNGPGMPENQIEYHSALFTNAEADGFVFKKQGLGLHMVIHLVKKLGAGIRFRSNSPHGTVVEVLLKVRI